MWPFSTQQERQAEAMSQILAENAYERRMERMAGWVRTWFAGFAWRVRHISCYDWVRCYWRFAIRRLGFHKWNSRGLII